MMQQLQQIFALPAGRLLLAVAVTAPFAIIALVGALREARLDLAFQRRRIAHMQGLITTEDLINDDDSHLIFDDFLPAVRPRNQVLH